jgi:hypothetical protein
MKEKAWQEHIDCVVWGERLAHGLEGYRTVELGRKWRN